MIWTILALASLTLMGGFIAYYGDLLGRRLGKKKVTWRGLRPRHTAMLLTSLTGAFIALLSIATLLIVNPPLRHAILYSESVINDNRDLNARLTAQRKQS